MSLTSDQLSDLPEAPILGFDEERKVLDNGETVITRKAVKFTGHSFKSNDPVMFTDSDGAWFVIYHLEGGPYKSRTPI